MIFVLYGMRVVGGVSLWVVCVLDRVYVAILSAMCCVICSLLMFLSVYGGNVLEYGSCYGFVCCRDGFFLFPPCC